MDSDKEHSVTHNACGNDRPASSQSLGVSTRPPTERKPLTGRGANEDMLVHPSERRPQPPVPDSDPQRGQSLRREDESNTRITALSDHDIQKESRLHLISFLCGGT